MFEDRSLKLDLCALVLVGARGVPRRRAVDVRPDRSAEHARSGRRAKPFTTRAAGPARSPPITCSKASASARTTWPARSAVLTFLLLVRREIDQPVLRTVGWAISVVGLTTLAALAMPNWTPGPVVGAGGYIGAMGRGCSNRTSPRPARTSSRSACCWPACCSRPITSCSAPRP